MERDLSRLEALASKYLVFSQPVAAGQIALYHSRVTGVSAITFYCFSLSKLAADAPRLSCLLIAMPVSR